MDQKFRRKVTILVIIIAALLMIPLVAMQFTEEVQWSIFDFVLMGGLLFGTGFTYLLVTRTSGNLVYRAACGVALGAALLLIWANGAVGLIGSENEPANLMYFGVLAVLLIGSINARLRPRGMAITLFATAAAQALVAIIALATGMQNLPESSVAEILKVNAFWVVLFAVSGSLFRNAELVANEAAK